MIIVMYESRLNGCVFITLACMFDVICCFGCVISTKTLFPHQVGEFSTNGYGSNYSCL